MRHLVLGTAGHIDHGKSALVEALTGTNPDRLVEEKRRGITIELGFADLALDDEHVLSIVDVPGHERFVRHMVAGATGIDAVLLVVAADQGVQPQTREHLQICSLLGLRRGVVALTKCDLVDAELREVVALELRELLEPTFLGDAPVVAVSARNGDGLQVLRAELMRLFEQIEPRSAEGVARLPVDRAFVMRGFGAVVTGTLVSGQLREAQEIAVLPGGNRGRVRGLQVHGRAVSVAEAGRRIAVNLQGLDVPDVPRGSTITAPDTIEPTRRIFARLTLGEDAPETLRRGGAARFHQGTCERGARFRVLSAAEDGSLRVELFLDEPTVLLPGDRFILRRPAPLDTLGGGVITDAHPPHRRRAAEEDFDPHGLEIGAAIRRRLIRAGVEGIEVDELTGALGLTRVQLEVFLEDLVQGDELKRMGNRCIDAAAWRASESKLLEVLAERHAAEPLRLGIGREELRSRVAPRLAQESWRKLLESVQDRGELTLRGDQVALAGHQVTLGEEDRRLADRIDSLFRESALEPPPLESLEEPEAGERLREVVDLLVAQGRLVRIHDGKLFHSEALARLLERLQEYRRRSRTIDVGAFKELTGVTRKHAIPLLEHLDANRVTRRVGNTREFLEK